MRKAGYFSQTNEQINAIISGSTSRIEILKKLGVANPHSGGWYRILNRYIQVNHISIKHFEPCWNKGKKTGPQPRKTDEQIFCIDSPYCGQIKRRYLQLPHVVYQCKECGLDSWREKKLSLQMDHINGDHCDNRLENLRLLCPNCHSQTDTYGRSKQCGSRDSNPQLTASKAASSADWDTSAIMCSFCKGDCKKGQKFCSPKCYHDSTRSKNGGEHLHRRKSNRPARATLKNDVESMSMVQVGKKYHVSDNAIRKWCKYMNIQVPKRKPKYPEEESNLQNHHLLKMTALPICVPGQECPEEESNL